MTVSRWSTVWWTVKETTTTCLALIQGPAVTSWRLIRAEKWTPGSIWSARLAASKKMLTTARSKIPSAIPLHYTMFLLRLLLGPPKPPHRPRRMGQFMPILQPYIRGLQQRRQVLPQPQINLQYLILISTSPSVFRGNPYRPRLHPEGVAMAESEVSVNQFQKLQKHRRGRIGMILQQMKNRFTSICLPMLR